MAEIIDAEGSYCDVLQFLTEFSQLHQNNYTLVSSFFKILYLIIFCFSANFIIPYY